MSLAREIACRIKVGTPYTITNRERMSIWIEEALEQEYKLGLMHKSRSKKCQ